MASRTEEQRKKQREYMRTWRAAHPLTEEQRAKGRIQAKRQYAALTEEQRTITREQQRIRYHARSHPRTFTEEQKAVRRERNRIRYDRYRATLTEEQLALEREKGRVYQAQWRQKNPKLAREIKQRYQSSEKGKATASTERSRETRRRVMQNWRKENPLKVAAKVARRRASVTGAVGFHTPEQLGARVAYYGGVCAYCQVAPYESIDHVIPLARGGSNWPANLRPACMLCNTSKGAKLLSEWAGPSKTQEVQYAA
jgi:5-methylcytosine-specific restriction endonuclease McrA